MFLEAQMPQTSFYGPHTERKLDAIERYLKSYLTALSRSKFETIYVDAFAGTGTLPIDVDGMFADVEESKPFVEGSVRRALALDRSFHRYVLIEANRKNAAELQKVKIDFPA